MNEIKGHVLEDQQYICIRWRAYITNETEAEFTRFKVNHNYNFVDPVTGIHTHTTERLWGTMKWQNKNHTAMARHHLELYLAKFMLWRGTCEKDAFDPIIVAIKDTWPSKEDT